MGNHTLLVSLLLRADEQTSEVGAVGTAIQSDDHSRALDVAARRCHTALARAPLSMPQTMCHMPPVMSRPLNFGCASAIRDTCKTHTRITHRRSPSRLRRQSRVEKTHVTTVDGSPSGPCTHTCFRAARHSLRHCDCVGQPHRSTRRPQPIRASSGCSDPPSGASGSGPTSWRLVGKSADLEVVQLGSVVAVQPVTAAVTTAATAAVMVNDGESPRPLLQHNGRHVVSVCTWHMASEGLGQGQGRGFHPQQAPLSWMS